MTGKEKWTGFLWLVSVVVVALTISCGMSKGINPTPISTMSVTGTFSPTSPYPTYPYPTSPTSPYNFPAQTTYGYVTEISEKVEVITTGSVVTETLTSVETVVVVKVDYVGVLLVFVALVILLGLIVGTMIVYRRRRKNE